MMEQIAIIGILIFAVVFMASAFHLVYQTFFKNNE